MTKTEWKQLEVYRVESPEQARLVYDMEYGARLLGFFQEPHIASEAAKSLSEPANRIAYHVGKLAEAGLLCAVGMRGKRTLYQAVAREFRVPKVLLPMTLDEPDKVLEPVVRGLVSGLKHSTGNRGEADGEGVVRLGRPTDPAPAVPPTDYLPFLEITQLKLSGARFKELQAALRAVAQDFKASEDADHGQTCTVALLSFRGEFRPGGQ